MHKAETAQKIVEAMRIYYNYCRVHSKLKTTPAERAGIDTDFQQVGKVEGLIRSARQNGGRLFKMD